MSNTQAPGGTPQRRGPMVDLDPSGQVTGKEPDRSRRQFMNYAFFKLDPAFRRLARPERREASDEFRAAMAPWQESDHLILRTYSLVGLRGDVDFMFWRIAHDLDQFQTMQACMNTTRLGAYLARPYSLLSMQKRSQYVNRIAGSGEGVELLPGQGAYLFVYPFVKTRAWYDLSPHARQGMMDEHIHAAAPFKGIRLNTSYSYGIDDQEFVVAFDSDHPQEFVDLVGRLRYTEASLYTQRDTPMFTCRKASLDEILVHLGIQ
jgi:chlorite dismutase